MEYAEKREESERESPPLQSGPRRSQGASRPPLQPIKLKTDHPRADFYNILYHSDQPGGTFHKSIQFLTVLAGEKVMTNRVGRNGTVYEREANEYDVKYVKRFDEDLNTASIFAGLLSAVSSAFAIDVHSNLQPNPNEQSAALLRAILLTLNQSAIPDETPTVTCLMSGSLMISLLTALLAMVAKQWISRYLRNSGGSVVERCGNRQRKFDGLREWSLHLFLTNLLGMLQISLLLLACGLCRYMWSINITVASTLIYFTTVGIGFCFVTVIASALSYASPFQTPLSIVLRVSWGRVRYRTFPLSKRTLRWIRVKLLPRRRRSPTDPLVGVRVQQPGPWLRPRVVCSTQKTNADDVQCVSWILREITDPEALDTATRFAAMIRWFDGIDTDPPYDQIVSTFEACFDSTGKLYPGSEDRAYHSGQAMVWIHTLATCKSEEFAIRFPINTDYTSPGPDDNLGDLLQVISVAGDPNRCVEQLLRINPHLTSLHSQWISDLLLNYSWANWTKLDHEYILGRVSETNETETAVPLEATLNRLLVWCTFLGLPVEEEMLRIQDKSDHIGYILDQLSEAVLSATNGTPTQRGFIPPMLRDLVKLKNYPFSSMSRGHIIRFIELTDYEWFERAGVERFVELLDYLHVTIEDMDDQSKWTKLLPGIIRTPDGAQRLSQPYWELLVEVAILFPQSLRDGFAYDPQITAFLAEAQEWRKLECWVAVVWMVWPPGAGELTEDLERSMLLLFRQQSGVAQKLEQWMERWSETNNEDIPDLFQRICRQAQEAARQDAPSISSTDRGT